MPDLGVAGAAKVHELDKFLNANYSSEVFFQVKNQ